MVCQNQKAVPGLQMIVFLPAGRVGFNEAPLNIAGISLEIKQSCDRLSRYCCVFTCLASRGVHQEMAYDFSTDFFLVASHVFYQQAGTRPE